MNEKLDEEWIVLMLKAKQIGLTRDEVSEFIKRNQGTNINDTIPTHSPLHSAQRKIEG